MPRAASNLLTCTSVCATSLPSRRGGTKGIAKSNCQKKKMQGKKLLIFFLAVALETSQLLGRFNLCYDRGLVQMYLLWLCNLSGASTFRLSAAGQV